MQGAEVQEQGGGAGAPPPGYDLEANLALLKLYQFNPSHTIEEAKYRVVPDKMNTVVQVPGLLLLTSSPPSHLLLTSSSPPPFHLFLL